MSITEKLKSVEIDRICEGEQRCFYYEFNEGDVVYGNDTITVTFSTDFDRAFMTHIIHGGRICVNSFYLGDFYYTKFIRTADKICFSVEKIDT